MLEKTDMMFAVSDLGITVGNFFALSGLSVSYDKFVSVGTYILYRPLLCGNAMILFEGKHEYPTSILVYCSEPNSHLSRIYRSRWRRSMESWAISITINPTRRYKTETSNTTRSSDD